MDYFLKRIQDAAFKVDLSDISDEDKKNILDNFNRPESEEVIKKRNDRLDAIVEKAINEYYRT